MSMPGLVKQMCPEQLGKRATGLSLEDIGQDAEILVAVGVSGARPELQAARASDHTSGVGVAKGRLGWRAMQHGDGPIITQAGLVVAEMGG